MAQINNTTQEAKENNNNNDNDIDDSQQNLNKKEEMMVDETALPLNDPPYTMQSIFMGSFCENNMKDFTDSPSTKTLLLPFEDENTWKLLNDAFKIKQPKISNLNAKSDECPEELKYLTNLFEILGQHKASKFCRWLNLIRKLGTSGKCASMDINKIGKKNELNPQQNGEEIYQTFFNKTLPFIKDLILSMPQIFNNKTVKLNNDENKDNDTDNGDNKDNKDTDIAFMAPWSNAIVSLSRGQIASILACCWFGIELYSHCSFHAELNVVGTPGKLEIFLRYFDFVRQKGIKSDWFNREMVTVWRRSLTAKQCECLENKNLINNDTVLCPFTVYDEGCIEDESISLHADFANQYIGGGVLEGGNVQEEIRFTVNTECIISKWLCPLPMKHNEAIIIFGSQQFMDYKGYGSSFGFNGYRNNKKEMIFCDDKKNRLASSVIIGIDAIYFFAPKNQINIKYMMREISKSYIGYSINNNDIGHKMNIISTGNWGCGIFRGDPQLKAMLQWISATLSNRDIAYYTFKDRRVADGILDGFIKDINKKKITVGHLWKILSDPNFQKSYKEDHCSVIDLLRADLL